MKSKLIKLIATMAVVVSSSAHAVPIQWTIGSGGNDHYYDLISNPQSWFNARTAAASLTNLGMTGYLATITSSAENSFINSMFNTPDAWIGANDIASEGTWIWATGPEAGMQFWQGGIGGSTTAPFNYAGWGAAEPNDFNGEDCGHLRGDGAWNDLPCNLNRTYVVEYNAPSVPEPTSLVLLGLGLFGMSRYQKRHQV